MTCPTRAARGGPGPVARSAAGFAAALIALLTLLPPPVLRAQTDVLTLEDAVKLALERNEQSLATTESVTAARARVNRARTAFMPNITATGVYTRRPFEVSRNVGGSNIVIQKYDALSSVVNFNMNLFDTRSFPALSAARSQRESDVMTASESRRQLMFQVSQSFLTVLSTGQVLEASRRRYDFAKQNLDAAKARFSAGLASVNDVTRAELEFATAEMGVIQGDGQLKSSRLALTNLLDAPETAGDTLVAPEFILKAAEETAPPASEELIAQAQNRRLDLGALRWAAKAQHSLATEPNLRYLPSLALNGQWRYTNEAGLTNRPTNYNFGLTLTWSVFDGLARHADYSERKALSRIADLNVEASMRQVELDVRDALVSVDNQRAALQQAIVAQGIAQRNAKETTELYRQGLASALQVADANVSLFEADVNLVRERYNLGLSYLNLRAATGLDPFGKEPVR